MELDPDSFRRLRRLAPILDDILNAGEIEHADQVAYLTDLAQLCSQLSDRYRRDPMGGPTPATPDEWITH